MNKLYFKSLVEIELEFKNYEKLTNLIETTETNIDEFLIIKIALTLIRENKIQFFKKILGKNIINNENINFLFEYCCKNNKIEFIKEFLNLDSIKTQVQNCSQIYDKNYYFLKEIFLNGNTETIKLLIENGFKFNIDKKYEIFTNEYTCFLFKRNTNYLNIHKVISDNNFIELLTNITTEDLKKFNRNSINHLCLLMLGLNGIKAQKLAFKVYENYMLNKKRSFTDILFETKNNYDISKKTNSCYDILLLKNKKTFIIYLLKFLKENKILLCDLYNFFFNKNLLGENIYNTISLFFKKYNHVFNEKFYLG